ncbi:hypothetical protein EYF80_021961 [Liparis tanakae]|uniref:Uncharacterized protein n=1 Tax=Liparis tanakae TaxID=230148 RepID=A0A4Z2HPV4_9TELE|nr:hypothetical protein EYF80_021961 [Liparis tanakae]
MVNRQDSRRGRAGLMRFLQVCHDIIQNVGERCCKPLSSSAARLLRYVGQPEENNDAREWRNSPETPLLNALCRQG